MSDPVSDRYNIIDEWDTHEAGITMERNVGELEKAHDRRPLGTPDEISDELPLN